MRVMIEISKPNVKTEFEVLVYKYANAIEGQDNAKAVRNVKSDRIDDVADALLVDNSFDKRLDEVVSLMHDFSVSVNAVGNNMNVAFSVPTRWAGLSDNLLSAAKRYIIDGMMIDWLNVTSPTEAAVYTARLPQDKTDILVELYAKKQP